MNFSIERHLANNPALALAECWYWIRKLQARFFAGDYRFGARCRRRGRNDYSGHRRAQFETAEYHFYAALARAACCDSALPISQTSAAFSRL